MATTEVSSLPLRRNPYSCLYQGVFPDVSRTGCHADQRNWQVLIWAVSASAALLFGQDAEHKISAEDTLANRGFYLRVGS